jgi:hypothetical protein
LLSPFPPVVAQQIRGEKIVEDVCRENKMGEGAKEEIKKQTLRYNVSEWKSKTALA